MGVRTETQLETARVKPVTPSPFLLVPVCLGALVPISIVGNTILITKSRRCD